MKKTIVPNTRIGHVEMNMTMNHFSEFYKQNPHLESRQKQYKFRGKTNTFLVKKPGRYIATVWDEKEDYLPEHHEPVETRCASIEDFEGYIFPLFDEYITLKKCELLRMEKEFVDDKEQFLQDKKQRELIKDMISAIEHRIMRD